jgi:hypothetical protein
MSLFENDQYRWRETYFVLFDEKRLPTVADLQRLLTQLGDRFELVEVREDEDQRFESLTLISPQDFAGMDITYDSGEDVALQVEELVKELARSTLTSEDREKLKRLKKCQARFEIFHFEQAMGGFSESEEDEYLDPGGLLIVMQKLADHCDGIAIDPQSGAFM